MYPPRSQRSSVKKKARRTRNVKIRIVNLMLIAAIGLIGVYYILNTREQQSGQPVPQEAAQQDPSPATDNQSGGAVNEPDADPAETPNEDAAPVDGKPDAETDSTDDSASSGAGASDSTENSGGKKDTGTKTSDSDQGNSGKVENSGSTKAPDPANDVIIHFVGDIQFSGKVAELLEKSGYNYPFAKLGSIFKDDDLTIGNLETPVTHGGTSAEDKSFVYKSSPKALQAMAAAGFDAVNLANNHILDQGVEGLVDTLTYLEQYGIAHAGAGMNGTEAYEPAYFERKGMKIALLGFSRVVPVASWKADGNRAGVAEAYDSTRAVEAIKAARKKADLVIVVAHWGEERVSTPNADQTRLAHDFVDAGADLIVGGHPHVLQGLENYKGKWIAYSTGNFIFTRSTTEETWKTAVFQASCSRDAKCSMKVIPYEAALGQAVPMLDDANRLLLEQMAKMSPGIRINTSGVATLN
ncbi:CapA family protein [Paenibacillus silvae]|uniref:CapA family protein n=1 Tax=Paenibacillus silvae TaxID=1325358 RepID=UPI00119D488C|nr:MULTISPECIES: CapA family protein [Paenibacillus]MCK6074260.1 CapA family protein [Paenibacillus silvae]MCK6148262.1 CapA family protein [Paenibacillus silvae]MCK6266562.1 CapA family protein [Paenibacillus silvae]